MELSLKGIRHISFDAWNTLLDPSKDFANARAWAIVRLFDVGHLTTASQKYSGVKKMLDTLAELKGVSFDVETNWRLLASQFKGQVDDSDLQDLRVEVEREFLKYPPTIPGELVSAMTELKKAGFTMNVLSNTNFIGGHVLETLFANTFGANFFDFTMYSDQDGLAKPSMAWFGSLIGRARVLHPDLQPNQMLHIGDNEITDYQGAKAAGIQALKIKSPHHLATVLLEQIK